LYECQDAAPGAQDAAPGAKTGHPVLNTLIRKPRHTHHMEAIEQENSVKITQELFLQVLDAHLTSLMQECQKQIWQGLRITAHYRWAPADFDFHTDQEEKGRISISDLFKNKKYQRDKMGRLDLSGLDFSKLNEPLTLKWTKYQDDSTTRDKIIFRLAALDWVNINLTGA